MVGPSAGDLALEQQIPIEQSRVMLVKGQGIQDQALEAQSLSKTFHAMVGESQDSKGPVQQRPSLALRSLASALTAPMQ